MADGITQPKGAPPQEHRILEALATRPDGLTQLEALQDLAVARLAAMVHRLKAKGHNIRTELIEVETRYGPATVARYHLVHVAKVCDYDCRTIHGLPGNFVHPGDCACMGTGKMMNTSRGAIEAVPCPLIGCPYVGK